MSLYRTRQDRPNVMERDAYASGVCPPLLFGAELIWNDIKAFQRELFAALATELGFPYWAEALGIPLTYEEMQARDVAITDYLQRGGTFDRNRVVEIVERYTGSRSVEIEDDINVVVITLPNDTTERQFAAIHDAIEAERPLHVDVRFAGSMPIGGRI